MDEKQNYSLLTLMQTHNSIKEVEGVLMGKNKFLDFKRELFNRILKFFPELKDKDGKKHILDQIEDIIETLEDQEIFKKVGQFIKQQEILSALFKKAIAQKKSKIDIKKEKPTKKIVKTEKKQKEMDGQVFVRLMPKNPSTTKFMVNANKFPRLEVKLSSDQHMQHLLAYLNKKWLKNSSHDISFYPQVLEGNTDSQPLNPFLMLTDLLMSYNWPQPNVVSLLYEIKQNSLTPPEAIKQFKAEEKKIIHIIPREIQKKQQTLKVPNDQMPKQNSIMFNNNSIDFDKSGMLGAYNSIDFQFMKNEYGMNSFSLFNRPSGTYSLEAIMQSIDIVSTQAKNEQNSFKQLRQPEEVLHIPVIKKTCKN